MAAEMMPRGRQLRSSNSPSLIEPLNAGRIRRQRQAKKCRVKRKGGSFVVFRGIIFDDPPVVRGYFGLYPSSTTGGGTGRGREPKLGAGSTALPFEPQSCN